MGHKKVLKFLVEIKVTVEDTEPDTKQQAEEEFDEMESYLKGEINEEVTNFILGKWIGPVVVRRVKVTHKRKPKNKIFLW